MTEIPAHFGVQMAVSQRLIQKQIALKLKASNRDVSVLMAAQRDETVASVLSRVRRPLKVIY